MVALEPARRRVAGGRRSTFSLVLILAHQARALPRPLRREPSERVARALPSDGLMAVRSPSRHAETGGTAACASIQANASRLLTIDFIFGTRGPADDIRTSVWGRGARGRWSKARMVLSRREWGRLRAAGRGAGVLACRYAFERVIPGRFSCRDFLPLLPALTFGLRERGAQSALRSACRRWTGRTAVLSSAAR
jgi:hypothetical protein